MNCINIVGRLTADPELKKTQSGNSVCQVDVAVNRPHKKDITDFLKVVVWRQSAEYLCQYGRKGNIVAVNGCLTTRKYEDKQGNKRTAYEIVADSVQLCSGKSEQYAQAATFTAPAQDFEEYNGADDELPF